MSVAHAHYMANPLYAQTWQRVFVLQLFNTMASLTTHVLERIPVESAKQQNLVAFDYHARGTRAYGRVRRVN